MIKVWFPRVCMMLFVVSLCQGKDIVPVIEICSSNIDGYSCTLVCSVEGLNQPVSYFHEKESVGGCNGGCFSADGYNVSRKIGADSMKISLTIDSLNYTHEGYWSCMFGKTRSREKKLTIYDAPETDKDTKYVHGFDGQSLLLKCDLNPKEQSHDVLWFCNGNQVYMNERFQKGSNTNLSLKIYPISTQDEGLYQCIVFIPSGGSNRFKGPHISVSIVKLHTDDNSDVSTYAFLVVEATLIAILITTVPNFIKMCRKCTKKGRNMKDKDMVCLKCSKKGRNMEDKDFSDTDLVSFYPIH